MSTEPKKIDVIIPIRNGAKYVEGAIRSILADAAVISKIIVIDDGSTDDTTDIIARIDSDTEIRVILQEPLGLVAALNRGLEEATSEFIARMDADDISLNGRLPAQLHYLISHPEIAVVGTQVEHIDEAGRLIGTKTNFPLDPAEIRRQLFEKGCVICHPTILARREFINLCGGYHNVFIHAEDYDLWLRLTDRYKIANLPDVFLQYRRHANQISNGRNIQQSLSRDFALWCARQRLAHRQDPSSTLSEPLNPHQLNHLADDKSRTLANLALAYDAINKTSEGRADHISNQAFRAIRILARNKYLGETRRTRYKLIRWAARTAADRKRFFEAAITYLALIGCRTSDSRLFRSIRRSERHSYSPTSN